MVVATTPLKMNTFPPPLAKGALMATSEVGETSVNAAIDVK